MKVLINLFVTTIFLIVFSIGTKAQYVFVPDQTGKPLTDARYENLTGSPYFIDEWTKGEVKLANGSIVKPDALKYDQVGDKLLFKQEGKVYEFSPKVSVFTLITNQGNKTFLLKNEDDKVSGYYELLLEGKISFLKKVRKSILESKGYNSANIEKIVDENKKYYIINQGKESEVKLAKKSFIEALPEFKDKISTHKLKSLKEEEFTNLLKDLNN